MQPYKSQQLSRRVCQIALLLSLSLIGNLPLASAQAPSTPEEEASVAASFDKQVKPLLTKYCVTCHSEEKRESGIRVDNLDGKLPETSLNLWEGIRKQVEEGQMPPEDEPQPSPEERKLLSEWIERGLHVARTRKVPRNGSARRLTVAQYQNTLRELLQIDENLTDILPPDGISKEGFTNNGSTMQLSPLQLEAYFEIAEKALSLAIVDEQQKPTIQQFRMDLGRKINPQPCPDTLVLGALNHLLRNEDFTVTEPPLTKPFPFQSFAMQRKFRFIEGYQGNDTVRGWRDFDSIYHAVFACMRGSEGYPKGRAYETVPSGLLLRPAIPSPEIFGESSTYGPHANFKISLRELPDHGRFRVTVRAAKYSDGLLLDRTLPTASKDAPIAASISGPFSTPKSLEVPEAGIYQINVDLQGGSKSAPQLDSSHLSEKLAGHWPLDGDPQGKSGDKSIVSELVEGSKFSDSPFGKSLSLDGKSGGVIANRTPEMDVGEGDFTVAAWIYPRELRQGGIVSLGGYGYTHGWLLDMPNHTGILRLETATNDRKHNGTVQSRPGMLRINQWQHVAAVIRRGENKTRLYVNGFEVASGTIGNANLDNPSAKLHIGRIPDAQRFQGEIDEVHVYSRALEEAELESLIEPGRKFAVPPFIEGSHDLQLTLGDRYFTGKLSQSPYLAVRLPAGALSVAANYSGATPIEKISLRKLPDDSPLGSKFLTFEKRSPRVGVHLGLRRDCGSTLSQVGLPQNVASTEFADYQFEGAISNFPSPDVEKDNVNYLAGIREIGIRSEFTDGRDMPRLLIQSITFEGPLYDNWPPAPHRNLFIESTSKNNPPAYAREILSKFATRAFRRPITPQEEASLFQVWEASYANSKNFSRSIQDTLLVILTSPQFLFLVEASQTPEPEDLDSWELASKLSYFLWNAPPDAQLLQRAADNSLRQHLDAEVDRMIADPKFSNFADQFASQWLSLDKFDVVKTDAKKFPKLTKEVKDELRKEPARFLEHLFRHNLSAGHLVRSDFILANEVVATYYGQGDKTDQGFEFVPIQHGAKDLGGVITHAAVLAGLSDGREANPVKRGAWFARRMIATPPDDPPPNVPKLEDLTQLSLRERLERHRNVQGCIKCHMGIDPWGLPFEQFDAGGLSKTTATDSQSLLPDGTKVQDFNALREYLLHDRIDQVAFSALKHLSVYATGRSLTYNESLELKEKARTLKGDGYRLKEFIRFIVHSDLFLKK